MISSKVIAVDLDGTITYTDTLHESVLNILKNVPIILFFFPIWLLKGRAYFKARVAESKYSQLDINNLPYNESFIKWLKEEKYKGKKIVLCSATNELIASAVAEHLKLFDDVMASTDIINLKSLNKRKALDRKYGEKGYCYAGNSSSDIPIWAGSKEAILVNTSQKVLAKVARVATVSKVFPSYRNIGSDFFKALRCHQWLKNLLLFVPFLAAHQFDSIETIRLLMLSFFSFCVCASSVYIINDLLDLESDRHHPRKRHRPFAAGKLPVAAGMTFAPLLVGISLTFGLMVSLDFLIILCLYFLLSSAYSLFLKRIALVDCLTLAALFTLRIIAGAVAISLTLSFWLMAFSVFIFLSLALLKRYAELIVQKQAGNSHLFGRSYIFEDAILLQTLGISAGYISTLVLALYMRSEDVTKLYSQPELVWFVIPLLLFWISWVWLKANRGVMHDDPIVFAAKDKASLMVAGLTMLVYILASVEINI